MARRYWLDLFTGTTWEEFLAAGGMVSGFRERRWKTVQRISVGDWLLCYATGISRWIGILAVTGEPFHGSDKIWGEDVFPARIPVEIVAQLTPENAVLASLLKERMSYYKPESPNVWNVHFRGSPALENQADGELVAQTILQAVEDPTPRPFSDAKWMRRMRIVETPTEEVTVPEPDTDDMPEQPSGPVTHEEIQWLLLKLGSEMGFSVWVARNDRNRRYREHVLGEVSRMRDGLPAQFDPATNRTIELIDVLWLDENAIVAAFEVEHTTSVYSGLLRMADLVSMQPNINIRLYIVAPDERREKVLTEVARPVFSRMKPPLRERCQFIPYSELKAEEERFRGRMQYLRPEFLDEIAESAE